MNKAINKISQSSIWKIFNEKIKNENKLTHNEKFISTFNGLSVKTKKYHRHFRRKH